MAASSCQMLWFLHLAAKARIDVVAYEDEARGIMRADDDPGAGVSEITLRPRITVAGDAPEERVLRLVGTAHEHCNIANSLQQRDAHRRPRPAGCRPLVGSRRFPLLWGPARLLKKSCVNAGLNATVWPLALAQSRGQGQSTR